MGIFLRSNSPAGEATWLILCLLLAMVLGISCSPNTHKQEYQKHVYEECGYTRYPDLCMATLSGLGLGPQTDDILSTLVERVREETKLPTPSLLGSSFQQMGLRSQHPHFSSIGRCHDLMGMSLKRLNQSLSALKSFRPHNKADVQTWLSAVLTFQETCKDSVKDIVGGQAVQISCQMDRLSKLASNALAVVNRISGHWQNITDSHVSSGSVFPVWVYRRDRKLLQSSGGGVAADAVVAKDGTGNYETITEAINAASGGRFVIHVKAGVYKEKIYVKKDGIVLIGDGKYVTIITNDDSVNGGSSMPGSATVWRSMNIVDANMSILRERMEVVRMQERLQKCCRGGAGWNYSSSYNSNLRRHETLCQSIKIAGLVAGSLGFTFLCGTLSVGLVSIMVHLVH